MFQRTDIAFEAEAGVTPRGRRRAISFLEHQAVLGAKRIGFRGTSYSGGHALVLGATERRLRAVVARVPTISGFEQGLRRIPHAFHRSLLDTGEPCSLFEVCPVLLREPVDLAHSKAWLLALCSSRVITGLNFSLG